jgi:hypothetical protein
MALSVAKNPPELFLGSAKAPITAGAGSEIFGPRPWAVALTGSQKEKAVARWMLEKDIPYFLPMLKSSTPGTRNTILNPVFDGVVFFESHTENVRDGYMAGGMTPREYAVRVATHVFDVLKTGAQVRFKRELTGIYTDRTLKLSRNYATGEPVKITEGPWREFTGVIAQPDDYAPVVSIRLEGLRQYAQIRVDAANLVRTAMKYVGKNGEAVTAERFYPHHLPLPDEVRDVGGGHFRIRTSTGEDWIESGDYIVTTEHGGVVRYQPTPFNEAYEPVNSG